MGIHGLSKLLGDNAPGAIRPEKFENYFGRKIAVDASMHIYQFMIAVGRSGDNLLTNEAGDVTSHLQARGGGRRRRRPRRISHCAMPLAGQLPRAPRGRWACDRERGRRRPSPARRRTFPSLSLSHAAAGHVLPHRAHAGVGHEAGVRLRRRVPPLALPLSLFARAP